MTRRLKLNLTCLLVGAFALVSPLAHSADRTVTVATEAELDNALTKALHQEDAARGAITSLLQRDDVRSLAEGYGLDVRKAEGAVSTLQGEELQRLSLMAAQADLALAGGDQILRISLVAALLIVIIIILVT
ncbi:MAG TPA: PA2779 family protein [Vicinamibacteria bacterium]